MSKVSIDIDPDLPRRFDSLRAFVHFRSGAVHKYLKVQAADMDMAPSTLSRKLAPADGDTQRFNVDDLEAWIESTGDAPAIVCYLASKYMHTDEFNLAYQAERLGKLSDELARELGRLKQGNA
jgi:hypothetical protein